MFNLLSSWNFDFLLPTILSFECNLLKFVNVVWCMNMLLQSLLIGFVKFITEVCYYGILMNSCLKVTIFSMFMYCWLYEYVLLTTSSESCNEKADNKNHIKVELWYLYNHVWTSNFTQKQVSGPVIWANKCT